MGPGRPDLFRIFLHRDPESGEPRRPFFFRSAPAASAHPGGRYDLPAPDGACYLALSPVGAWLEVFRTTGLVASEDVRRRRMLATRPPRPIRTANLLAPAARAFGVTGEIHTHDDRAVTRAWATRLHEAGFRALLGKARHDPGLRQRSLTLLDRSGEHEPYGWRWRKVVEDLHDQGGLVAMVGEYGYRVLEPPHDVETEE